jgi:hypothetical protein
MIGVGEEGGRRVAAKLKFEPHMGWGVLFLFLLLLLLLEVVREGQDFGGYGMWDLICNLSFFLRQKKAMLFIYEALCLPPSSC